MSGKHSLLMVLWCSMHLVSICSARHKTRQGGGSSDDSRIVSLQTATTAAFDETTAHCRLHCGSTEAISFHQAVAREGERHPFLSTPSSLAASSRSCSLLWSC